MDSRDSSSTTVAAAVAGSVNRDGGEDDGALNGLAREAAALFESGKYDECVNVMIQLSQKKPDDPKVIHNLALAEFFRDGCSDTKKLLDTLKLVKKRNEELVRASGEQMESTTGGNKTALALKGSSPTNQLSAANTSSTAYTDEFDASVATHNIALLWFHRHEYSRVLSILDPLYHNIEPIDEATALHICLLLLDASLACQDASRSFDVFHHLEKTFGVGSGVSQGDNGSAGQPQSANLVSKSSSIHGGSTVDASSLDQSVNANSSENSLSRTLSEENLEYETMLKTLDIGGQNMGRPAGVSSPNDVSSNFADRSIPAVDLKLKLQLYKVRLLLLTRNLKLAKREVKLAINVARGRDSSVALLLKSQLEHARGNHSKAIKLLTASSSTPDMGYLSMFFNNLACIYHHLGNSNASSTLFTKALKTCSSLRKEEPLKLSTQLQDKSLLIMYNCGLQHLDGGKPILAARCFQKASLLFHNRPLFWLRFAECCLMALEKGLLGVKDTSSDGLEVRVNVIGQGKWRQLAVDDGLSTKGPVGFAKTNGLIMGNEGPVELSLSFARLCIYNAVHLLNCFESNCSKSGLPANSSMVESQPSDAASAKNSNQNNVASVDSKVSALSASLGHVNVNADAKEQKGGPNQENIQNSVSLYEETRKRENMMIKQVLLANLAFIELELENPLKTLSVARSLLDVPGCSKIFNFLGHVYAAEALCILNRPNEAAELLSLYLSGGNNVEAPYKQEHLEQWRVEKIVDSEEVNSGLVNKKTTHPEDLQGIKFLRPEAAQGTLFANFAAVAAMQGEMEQAHEFAAKAISIIPDNPDVNLTAVYVDLMRGNTQGALSRLKQCNRVRFLPHSLTLEKAAAS